MPKTKLGYPTQPLCCIAIECSEDYLIFKLQDKRSLRVPIWWMSWWLKSQDASSKDADTSLQKSDMHHYTLSKDGRTVFWPLFDAELFIPDLFNTEISDTQEHAAIKWRQENHISDPTAEAQRVVVGEHYLTVEAVDGRIVSWPMAEFPFLLEAPLEHRMNFEYGGKDSVSIYWPDIDEAISVDFLFGHPCR